MLFAAAVALALVLPRKPAGPADHPILTAGHGLVPVGFSALPGFGDDDLTTPFAAFLRSCAHGREEALASPCTSATALDDPVDAETARAFFEGHFQAYRIDPVDDEAVITAYYEPVVAGSLRKTADFPTPLYPLPPDFVRVTGENRPEGWDDTLSWGRRTSAGLVPTPTRAEIDAGALGDDLEPLVYVADPIEAFYIHIQGSTRIALTDGSTVRIGYAGKNGHPYSSVGKAMMDRGIRPDGGFSMDSMRAYFHADLDRARDLMQVNKSYIFFRKIKDLPADLGPIGGEGVPLTAGRSIAVDTKFHAYGTPIFIDSQPQIGDNRAPAPFRRLMIAQDTGSAIKGPARADLFWGTGEAAGSMAGGIKAGGTFYVLLPKD